jgi:hypothetical protein
MEKRSRRRARDLVTQAASQGLSENEIGCARISMMARSTNTPCKGRIQMRKTNPLHLLTFGLQRTAGPYRWVTTRLMHRSEQHDYRLRPYDASPALGGSATLSVTGRCRYGAVMEPVCSSGSRSPWSILLTSEKLNEGESHTHLIRIQVVGHIAELPDQPMR